jgi:hypothetical protein
MEYRTPDEVELNLQILAQCNTSTFQFLSLQTTDAPVVQTVNIDTVASETDPGYPLFPTIASGGLNISAVLPVWFYMLNAAKSVVAPDGMMSVFSPCLAYGGLSSISFTYDGKLSIMVGH